MFSKLPQTLSAPFGILGDEAKLRFRSQPSGISRLASVRVCIVFTLLGLVIFSHSLPTQNIPESDTYWEQFFVLFDSPSDVYSLVAPNDIRRALFEAPENVATLIRVVIARLSMLISDHTFPSSSAPSVSSLASSIMKTRTGLADGSKTKEVLNCLRLLQRVFPVIFEIDGDTNLFEAEVLWKRQEVDDASLEERPSAEPSQFVIEDEDDEEEDGEVSTKQGSATEQHAPPKAKKELPSLAERLFSSLIDLLFCCGFTLPTKIQVDHHKINYVIWERGVGSTVDLGPNQAYDNNKIEVLRLLLVLLSRQIYVPSGSLFTKPSAYTLHLTQKIPRRSVLTILCSLLNTAMNGNAVQQSSIGGLTGKLPYNHLVLKGEDSRSALVTLCLDVLCVVLDFQSGNARDPQVGSADNQTSTPTSQTNAFRYFLAKLHRTQDMTFLLDGILAVFQEHAATMANVLPGSRKPIPYIPEIIIFFWKLVELNKKFRTFILESEKAMDIVSYLLLYTLDIKDKPHQHGLCRALSYIIQTLSAEPTFGEKLSLPLKVTLPAKWQSPGTSGDFMINAVYSIIATTSGALNSLYPALIISLSNSAPYFKNLTITASARLIQLFTSFSNPLFLLSDEGHPRLLFFMLEVFNAIILHHPSENPNLTYAVLTSHKAFEDLSTFTLNRGLRDIHRAQQTKEEQNRRREGVRSGDPLDNAERGLEKTTTNHSRTTSTTSPRGSESHDPQARMPDVVVQMPTSPTTEGIPPSVSDKARGKMKAESRSSSFDLAAERAAAIGVGRNGFVPTQEWVSSWQQGLPLDTVLLLISELLPKIQEIQSSRAKANSVSGIRDFLASITLDHVLPPAPSPSPRRFVWSDASIVWLTSLIWGEVYVRHMTPLGIWNSTSVKLFYVRHAQSQQRLTETMSNVMGGFLGRTTTGDASPVRRT